jgi:hypothetical protein
MSELAAVPLSVALFQATILAIHPTILYNLRPDWLDFNPRSPIQNPKSQR